MRYVSFKVKEFFKVEKIEDFEVVKMLSEPRKVEDEEPSHRPPYVRRSPTPSPDDSPISDRKRGVGSPGVGGDAFVRVAEFAKVQQENIDLRKGLREVREKLSTV